MKYYEEIKKNKVDPYVPLQEASPDLPVSVKESLAGVWVGGGLLQGQGCWVEQCMLGPFEGGHHYLHHLHHSLASGPTTGREHSPSTENWSKDLLNMALPIRTRPSFPLSLSHQEISISFSSLFIRGQTEWKPRSQKTNQTDHMDHSLI